MMIAGYLEVYATTQAAATQRISRAAHILAAGKLGERGNFPVEGVVVHGEAPVNVGAGNLEGDLWRQFGVSVSIAGDASSNDFGVYSLDPGRSRFVWSGHGIRKGTRRLEKLE